LGYYDHLGTLTQGLFFLLDVAAVDDVMRLSVVRAGDFGREGSGRGAELVGDLDTVHQGA
jgi:hypothetical protein